MTSVREDADRLRDRLSVLHQELGRSPALDEDTRRLLETLQRDIERLLDRETGAAPEEHASVLERLEEAAMTAERSNPTVADAINRVAQILSNMGI